MSEPVDCLSETTGYVLECEQGGVWRSFTAVKTDPADVVRTYDFGKNQDPDEVVRVVEVRTVVRVRDIEEIRELVKPDEEG